MASLAKYLLKYDTPVSISQKTERRSPKSEDAPETKKSSAFIASSGGTGSRANHDVLNSIHKPKEWTAGNHLFVQQVSTAPCTRTDVVHLEEALDAQLHVRQAKPTGICPVRRELYSQCFDELIRQDTINCVEKGLLMARVRGEIQMTLAAYENLIISKLAFDMRKGLQEAADISDMKKRIAQLEKEKRDLMEQVDQEKARCEDIENEANEKAQEEEAKATAELESLREIIQKHKAQLEEMIQPKQ